MFVCSFRCDDWVYLPAVNTHYREKLQVNTPEPNANTVPLI